MRRHLKIALIATALVLAGWLFLTGSTEDQSITLKFPENADLGEVWLVEDPNCFTCGSGQKKLGRASGPYDVSLPARHWFVSLRMPKQASALMPHLADPSLSKIGDVWLAGSDVRDEDLRYLAGTELRSINLSETGITGEGLRHLKPHSRWFWLDLTGCGNLDVETLAHFRGWKRMTLRVVGYKSSGQAYTEAEQRLLADVKRAVCSDQPEDVCGTQIR